MPDQLHRFTLEHFGVRGELVSLAAGWQAVVEHHNYSASVRDYLGQSLVAATRLSGTIEFQGSLILQLQGDGPLTTLAAMKRYREAAKKLPGRAALPIRRSHHGGDATES
jgi:molecular chaperone Hsp33